MLIVLYNTSLCGSFHLNRIRDFQALLNWMYIDKSLISWAHSFPRQNLTNSAANLVNSAAHRGKADEILRLTADTQLNFRGLIKS